MNLDDYHKLPSWRRWCWMTDLQDIIGPHSLPELCLLGSHNSATYGITRKAHFGQDAPSLLRRPNLLRSLLSGQARRLSTSWGICQRSSIMQQLLYGVRYLDLRLSTHSDGKLYVCHCQLSVSLEEVVTELLRFLDLPGCEAEFVVVDVQHLYFDTTRSEVEVLKDGLSSLAARCLPNTTPLTSPLRQLLEADAQRRVLLLIGIPFEAEEMPFAFARSEHLTSLWRNKCKVKHLLNVLGEDGEEEHPHCSNDAMMMMFVTQGILTPRAGNVAKGVLSRVYHRRRVSRNNRDLAIKANSRLLSWFWSRNVSAVGSKTKNMHGNVLLLDHVDEGMHEICFDGHSFGMSAIDVCVTVNLLRWRCAES